MPTANREWVLREQVGRDWSDELLCYDASFSPGERSNHAVVMRADGRVVPTQVGDVVRHADGSVASMRIWCRISLAAEQTVKLSLADSTGAAAATTTIWRAGTDGFEAGNALLTVRVPASGAFAADAAPGWITAVRIGDAWIGRGRMRSPVSLTLHTEPLDHGPLFVRWRTSVHHETRRLASAVCTVFAGEDFVRIDETSSRDADLAFAFNLIPGFGPDRLLTKGGGEHIEQHVVQLDHGRAEELAVIDFNSGHHQMSLSWFGLYQGIDDAPKAPPADGPFVGVIELDGCRWTHVSVNRLHLCNDPPDDLSIVSPVRGGEKSWALVCSTRNRHLKQAGDKRINRLCETRMRWADVPLQKVKNWQLDWTDAGHARPLLQSGPDSIESARARVAADPELTRAYRAFGEACAAAKWPTGSPASCLATLWIALNDPGAAGRAVEELEKEIRVSIDRFWSMGGYMRLIIFDGRMMKLWLQAYDVLKAGGLIPPDADRRIRRDLAFLAYCFADPQFFPHRLNLLDHRDPESWMHPGGLGDRIGDAMCPPNFHTEYYTSFGMFACCFRDHPMSAAWIDECSALFDRQLQVHFYDSGAYCESPNYHTHVFVMENQTALSLRRAGGRDFFEHPRFKAQFGYFCDLLTPPIVLNPAAREFVTPARYLDTDLARYALMPSQGNSGRDCSDQYPPMELVVGGAVYRESDPALSRRCMEAWRRAGRTFTNQYDNLTFLLVADPTLPGTNSHKLDHQSKHLTGAFVLFRGAPETDDEVFVLTKNGTATHHNDFDEGGFSIWAYGAPICGDFGYHAEHNGRRYGTGDTWKHNCVEFDGKSSGYLGIEKTSPPEKWVTTGTADLLVSHLPITNLRDLGGGSGMTYLDQVPCRRIEYRRYTLFVKPHYMIVLDSILDCAYAHKWWLHAQADAIRIEGPRVRFIGRYGTDVIAHFIAPHAPTIHEGAWSVMKHIWSSQALAKDWRVFVAPARQDQDFQVASSRSGRVASVAAAGYRDTVMLAHHPFEHEHDGIRFKGRAGVVRRWADGRIETTLLDGTALEAR